MPNNDITNNFWLWTLLLTVFIWLFGDINEWSALGLAISICSFFVVIKKMGKTIPVIDLMVTMAAFQWIVGPYIDYHNELTHYKYKMYVEEPVYMGFIVPAIIAFKLGTHTFRHHINLEEIGNRVTALLNEKPSLPYLLIGVGVIAPLLINILPPALRFVFFLLSNLKYVGVIYLLFSESPKRWLIFILLLASTTIASIASGMFHDLLLWAMLTFTFVARELQLSFSVKIAAAVVGMFMAVTIQSVKHEYRELTWRSGYQGNRTTLFINLSLNQWRTGGIVTPVSDQDINVRLNQGWIISSIMNHMPEKEPHAGGSTIREALYASFVPRLLDPNKKMAGGQENFIKFTGQQLSEGTSMGISLAGEGFANYGRWGGILFMFLWGIFISWFWRKLEDWSNIFPTLLIWSPILFLQVVKAETELVVVLNHLIKASVLVFGVLWGIKRYLGIRV